MDKFIYTEEELPQRSDEWLEKRKLCIGGSEVATILGLLDKYDKAINIWKRKTGKLKPKSNNAAMLRGALMEDEARDVIKEHYKSTEGINNPDVVPYFAIHPDYNYLAASFDGVDVNNKFITEIKCPGFSWNFLSVFTDGIQDYYYPQVQLQLFIANKHWGIDKAYFCSYYPDGAYVLSPIEYKEYLKTLAVIDVDYDEEYCNHMNTALKKFWRFVEYDYWDEKEYKELIKEFNTNVYKEEITNE